MDMTSIRTRVAFFGFFILFGASSSSWAGGQQVVELRKSLIERLVAEINHRLEKYYGQNVVDPGGIAISKGVLQGMPQLDGDHDGRLSRVEMQRALTEGKVALSFLNAVEKDAGRVAQAQEMARAIIDMVDAEDGIRGGQIRIGGSSVDSDKAARNLTSGAWVFGKLLGDAAWVKSQGYQVIALHINAGAPKITLP